MIKIYDANVIDFTDKEYYILNNVYKAEVTKQAKKGGIGDYYITLETNINDKQYLEAGKIIAVDIPDGSVEYFRISNYTIEENNHVYIKAYHIAYDTKNFIVNLKPTALYNTEINCTSALSSVVKYTNIVCNFNTNSDVTTEVLLDYENVTLFDAIEDIANKVGGYVVFTNRNIEILSDIGADREVVIADSKNLVSFKQEESWDDVCTTLLPLGNKMTDENGNEFIIDLPEGYLHSTVIYPNEYVKVVTFDTDYEITTEQVKRTEEEQAELEAQREAEDAEREANRNAIREQKEAEKEQAEFLMTTWTKEEYEEQWQIMMDELEASWDAEDEEIQQLRDIEDGKTESYEYARDILKQKEILREKAYEYLNSDEHKYPKISYTVASNALLVDSRLGDTILVKYRKADLDILTRVTEIKYDCVTNKIKEFTFGNFDNSYIKTTIQKTIANEIAKTVIPATNKLKDRLILSADIIQKNLYHSHMYQTDNATYFLNADTPEEATKFLILSLGGIGFGEKVKGEAITGTESYDTAWDIEGNFNAKYITTGTLSSIDIKGCNLELYRDNGLNRILMNPADGMKLTKIVNNVETPIFYLDNEGNLRLILDDGKELYTAINVMQGNINSIVAQYGGLYPSETLFPSDMLFITDKLSKLANYMESLIKQTKEQILLQVSKKADDQTVKSQLSILSDSISSKVSAGEVSSIIKQDASLISLIASRVNIDTTDMVTFTDLSSSRQVTINNGKLTSCTIDVDKNFMVDESGFVTSNSGDYGGWRIQDNSIFSIADIMDGTTVYGKTRRTGFQSPTKGLYAIAVNYLMDQDWSTGYFTVTHSGNMKCQNATVNGTLVANNAIIGGSSFNGHSHATANTVNASLYSCSNGKGNYVAFSNGGQGATTGWCSSTFQKISSSDERLKKDISELEYDKTKSIYMKLEPIQYKYKIKSEPNSQKTHYGLSANKLVDILDENDINFNNNDLVDYVENTNEDENECCGENKHYIINYDNLHAMHIQMIQQQQKLVESQQKAIEELTERIKILEEKE